MDLDDRDIQEFTEMWQEEFKEVLSPAEARHCASLILELYFVLYGPDAKSSQPHDGPQPVTQ
jgi:hypothetical protein